MKRPQKPFCGSPGSTRGFAARLTCARPWNHTNAFCLSMGVRMSIRKLMAFIPGLTATAIMTAAIAKPAAAQGGVELTPWAGAYVPTSNSFSTLSDDFTRDVSVVGGARLTFWGTGHLG